jgi:hypothetical protein
MRKFKGEYTVSICVEEIDVSTHECMARITIESIEMGLISQ